MRRENSHRAVQEIRTFTIGLPIQSCSSLAYYSVSSISPIQSCLRLAPIQHRIVLSVLLTVQSCPWDGWGKLEWGKLNYIANKMLVSLESLIANSCVTKFYQLPNGASGLFPSRIVGSEGGGKLVGKPPLLITRDTTCPQIIESCPIFSFKKSLFGSPFFKSPHLCNFEPLTWDEKC